MSEWGNQIHLDGSPHAALRKFISRLGIRVKRRNIFVFRDKILLAVYFRMKRESLMTPERTTHTFSISPVYKGLCT